MKIIKTASGKKSIKISKKEWQSIGKTAGWLENKTETDQIISKIMNNLLDYFGKGQIKNNSFEIYDESLGACWIQVSYLENNIIYIDKYYENENMDNRLGQNIKISYIPTPETIDEITNKVINIVKKLKG